MKKSDIDSMSAIISNAIGLSLNDTYKKISLHANDDLSQVSSSYSKYKKQIQEMEDELNKFNKYLESLDKVTSKASIQASDETIEKALKLIDKKLRGQKYIEKQIQSAKDIAAKMQDLFGNSNKPALKKLADQSVSLISKWEKTAKLYNEHIHKFVQKKRPPILAEKFNKAVQYLFNYIKDCTKDYDDFELKAENNTYSIGLSKANNSICCIRFIPMNNVPLTNGKTKNLYLVLGVNLPNPEFSDKGRFTSSESSHLMIGIVDSILPIEKLPKLTLVEDTLSLKKSLELFAHKLKLNIFGYKLDKKEIKDKRNSELNVLGDKRIKIDINNSIVLVGIPKDIAEMERKDISSDMNQDIIDDLMILTGLSDGNTSNGEITKLGTAKEKNSLIIVKYKILSVNEEELNHFDIPNDNPIVDKNANVNDSDEDDVDKRISREDKIANSKEDITKLDREEDIDYIKTNISKRNYREQFNLNEFED